MKFFGQGICDLFMYPYNEKIWGVDLTEMNNTWIRARFPTINVEELKQTLAERKVQEWGANAYFRYPVVGGNGATWKRLSELLP